MTKEKLIEEIEKERKWLDEAGYNAYNIDVAFATIFNKALRLESKTDRLYNWLNVMRYGITPDETTLQDERSIRLAQVDIIEKIMEWLEENGQKPYIGHWVKKSQYGNDYCSECGYELLMYGKPKYCPDCGARMESEG